MDKTIGLGALVIASLGAAGFYYWRLWLIDPWLALASILMTLFVLGLKAVDF